MILIGEKLNGSIPAVARAIEQRDEALIKSRAKAQADAGAMYLDVCAAVSPDREAATLRWMIGLVESVTDTPICIDSPDTACCVHAMPDCSRPGMINSVSGEGDKLDVIFSAIQGTEWRCVALLSDDGGIPDTVEKRIAVLHRIMKKAAFYGIPHDRLFIDPLVTTLSTDGAVMTTFLACCRRIRQLYPDVHITSGLSNISFGLPAQKYVKQSFAALALHAGMDSAILDPTNDDLIGVIRASEALLELDPYCARYIAAYKDAAKPAVLREATPDDAPIQAVFDAVGCGKFKEISALVSAALDAGFPPLAILNDAMIRAMNHIGERYTAGEIYIPEMLIAARTMKKGVEILRPRLATGDSGALGTVVIGTVLGDQHDIGKNLVAMMLESAGFTVVDLGVDVSAAQFEDAIRTNENVRIVALSTLLTTTMPAMQSIVQALLPLKSEKRFSIMVGGSPVTQAFATEIGADAYTADAAACAKTARRFVL